MQTSRQMLRPDSKKSVERNKKNNIFLLYNVDSANRLMVAEPVASQRNGATTGQYQTAASIQLMWAETANGALEQCS